MTASDRNVRVARLSAAAATRRAEAETRARRAIIKLENAGEPVTFVAVARRGAVSTSFLYQHQDLHQQILNRRNSRPSCRQRHNPEAAPAASLRVKLQVAIQRNRDLTEELAVLRTENDTLRSRLVEIGHQQPPSSATTFPG